MPLSKKILFIINPVSGIGKQKKVEGLIETLLDKKKYTAEISYTEGPKHATEIAKNAVNNNFDIVVAIGGDGSVNETAQGLVNTNTSLGIIPAGSGNGLARHLGIPMNIKKAMSILNESFVTSIDTLEINSLFCVGIAGVGLDAHIGWKFSQFGKRGFLSYIKVFIREFPTYKLDSYLINIDGKEIERKAMLVSIANSSQFGNNAYIAPMADITDGLMDVCIVKNFPTIHLPYLTYLLFKKKIHLSKYVEIIKCKEIDIVQTSNYAHIDGEPIIPGNKIHAKINPQSLKVVVPQTVKQNG